MVFLSKVTILGHGEARDANWLQQEETIPPDYGYDREVAKHLSIIAGWSYSDRETFIDKLARVPGLAGGNYVEISVKNDAMLVIATAQIIRTEDKKSAIVCFRGTELTNVVNWVVDAGTNLVKFPGQGNNDVKVHEGFLRNFQEVWNGYKGVRWHLLRPETTDEGFDDYTHEYFNMSGGQAHDSLYGQKELKSIFICGHSLGGAMALLCGLTIQQNEADFLWKEVRGIYTYGQPMVISNESACVNDCKASIGDRLFRFVYKNDVVPHVPPLTIGVFDHIGTEYRYNGRDWVQRSGQTFLFFFKDQATQVFTLVGAIPFAFAGAIAENVQYLSFLPNSPWSFTDHSPLNYIKALWNIEQEVIDDHPLFRLDGAHHDQ